MSPLIWLGFLLLLEPVAAARETLKMKSGDAVPRASQPKYQLKTKGTEDSGNDIFCIKNVYLENGKFKEVPKLQVGFFCGRSFNKFCSGIQLGEM